ncbi:acyl carrier protein [Streptomyces sp. LN785]|uniref:acyl carrier protein n=1 Tax=Streptomyces sp. LN785 TaxID=3112983 RepID=UPI003710AB01
MTAERQTGAAVREQLARTPRAQRRAALEAFVSREFKQALLMTDADELPLDENYFDLGVTSLRAVELRQRIEEQLGCELDTSVLFGLSTVRQVADHLVSVVLPDAVVPRRREPEDAPGPSPELQRQVSDLIADLYES